MWSNSNRKAKAVNIKSYLGVGRFTTLSVELEENNESSSSLSNAACNSCQSSSSSLSSKKVSVLVEIPEELDQTARNSMKEVGDSAVVTEIGNNLMDLDNYMLSVFHMENDASSIYTTGTPDTASLSSSSSSSTSTVSTRRRHRGAYRSRKEDILKQSQKQHQQQQLDRIIINKKKHSHSNNWIDSMRISSMNIFVEGEDGWTPSKGWKRTSTDNKNKDIKRKGWDPNPQDEYWNNCDPIFDSIKHERLEI
jgi:hypothetical protein